MPSESGTPSQELKKTPWFDPAILPVYPGVYEISLMLIRSPWYRKFQNGHWFEGYNTPEEAAKATKHCNDPKFWRGLASDPSQP